MRSVRPYFLVCITAFYFVSFCFASSFNFDSRFSVITLKPGAHFTVGSDITDVRGVFVKESGATISGSNIVFSNGCFEEENSSVILSGTYNSTTGKIVLDGGKKLRSESGEILRGISISGSGNRIDGQPLFSSAIEFDANATLTLAIQSTLNKNVLFDSSGSNTLRVENNLCFADGVTVLNDGTIDLNGKKISFAGNGLTLGNNIHWRDAAGINLNGKLILNGVWNVDSKSTLNGRGNVVDVSGGGVFDVAASTTFCLADVTISGVKNSTFVFRDVGSTLRLSNVTLQVDEDISFSKGMFFVDGASTVVLHDHDVTLGVDSRLSIDSFTLWLDGAGVSSAGNLLFSDSDNYESVNSGCYRYKTDYDFALTNSEAIILHEARLDNAESNVSDNADNIVANSELSIQLQSLINQIGYGSVDSTIETESYVANSNVYLAPQHKLHFSTDTVYNGSSNNIHFAQCVEPILILDAGVSVTLQDVVLKNFDENKISFGDGSRLALGDGVELELCENILLKKSWTCSGSVLLDGVGKKVTIADFGGLVVASGSQLVVQDIRLFGLKNENVRCEGDTASILFRNSKIRLSDDFSFSNGSILFDEDVWFAGRGDFCYMTSLGSTVSAEAQVHFDTGFTFSYLPVNSRNDLIIFEDDTSTLILEGGRLHAQDSDLILKKGTLKAKGNSSMSSSDGNKIIFGNDLSEDDFLVSIENASALSFLSGVLEYRNVDFSSMIFANQDSRLKIYGSLYIYQVLPVWNGVMECGRVDFYNGSELKRRPSTIVDGPIATSGSVDYGLFY